MTVTVRVAQPLNAALTSQYTFTNEVRTVNALNVEPISITRDLTTVIGAVKFPYATGLYAIPDDGVTAPILINTMANKVTAFTETGNGEALCSCNTSGGSVIIYRSTGWGATLAQKQAATWTQVHTMAGSQGTLPSYSMGLGAMSSTGVMVLSDQGGQSIATTATGDNAADNATAIANNVNKAIHGYVTVDFGQTWVELINLLKVSPLLEPRQINNVHCHAFVYDEEWDRVWLTFGDYSVGQPGANIFGNSATQVIYSDDWRNVLTGGTATWTPLPFPTDYSISSFLQFVGMRITPKSLTFTFDRVPYGLVTYARTGYRTLGKFRNLNMVTNAEPCSHIGREIVQVGANKPMFAGHTITNSAFFIGNTPKIFCSHDNGLNWYEIWRDPVRSRRATDTVVAYGPTVNNKMVAVTTDTLGGTRANGSIITWNLVAPA